MSRRPRKTDRHVCSPSTLNEARRLIAEGKSKRAVAQALGMAESTLRFRLQQTQCATKLGRFDTTFSVEVEKNFCEHLKTLDNMFFGLTAKTLRSAAYEYAEKHKIPHRFNRETKIAGKEWLRGFLKRHPDIALRRPTSTSIARAIGFNKPQVQRFYINLSALLDKYQFAPQSIYNMDETGVSTVPNRPPKVLSVKGKRAVNKISSGERGINVTVVNAVSATGHFIPPSFIFGRKKMKAELLDGSPSGSIGMISDSSFINGDLFINWLSHFKHHAKPTADQPILLILDNHLSHCTLKAVDFYRENNIIALTLPPHSSHKMQPLDRGFHGALKKYYASECEKWLRNHPGRAITVYQITNIFTPAFYKAATITCGVESFRSTGIYPWNPDVFSDVDFLACSATEREIQNEAADDNVPITSGVIAAQVQMISTETSVQPVTVTSASKTPTKVSETSKAAVGESSGTQISAASLADIVPLPKSEVRRSSNRKHKKSDIISSSPYKAQLEKENEPKNTLQNEPKNKKAKKDYKKPKSSKKKKIWSCRGCNEVFKEPIEEDWIECHVCQEWWHEQCSDYTGLGTFKCDLCK